MSEHAKLVDIAVAWLRRGVPSGSGPRSGSWKCKHAFGEYVGVTGERPDAIGWHTGGWSIVVECKTSRADFNADRAKVHMRGAAHGMGRRRYYLIGADVAIAPEEVPEWCGLARVKGAGVDVLKFAPLRELDGFSAREECSILMSAVRRWTLGVPFDEKRGRFRPVPKIPPRSGPLGSIRRVEP